MDSVTVTEAATAALGIATALTPFAVVAGLLRLAEHVSRRRESESAQQIRLTDAIHREVGAVAAPVVRRDWGGRWLVSMAVPLDRPGTTAAIVRITERMFAQQVADRTDQLRIVLAPATAEPATGDRRGRAGGPRFGAPIPALR